MPALGFYERGEGLEVAPVMRIGVGFGRDRVVAMRALVDTGSDVCVFPDRLAPGFAPEKGEPAVVLEFADGRRVPVPLVYPSVTAGDIREVGVASAILPDAPAILGRSFLNRLDLRLVAPRGLVRLQSLD